LAAGGLFGLAAVAARRRLGALLPGPLAWAHGLAGIGGYHALYFAALGSAPAVEANLLNYSWPLLIVLFSGLVSGLRLGAQRLIGVAMGAAGAVLLLAGEGTAFPAEAWLGFACALAAALVWALYSVLAARLGSVPSEAVAGFCLASAGLAGLAHMALEPPATLEPRHWAAVALMGLGPTGAAFFLWDHGMKRGDPRLLGTLAYAVPVASTLLLVAAGEGELSARMLVAAALVSGGGLLAALAGRRG
jgi:drug/metabolite transporter (DMT)-like permease